MIKVELPQGIAISNIATFESILKAEVMDWLFNNFEYSQWNFDHGFRTDAHWIEFRREEDAVLFKLRWF